MLSRVRTQAPRRRWRAFLERFSETLEMPRDVLLDVPRVTLIGSMQVQVENHKGVLEYTPTRVRIATSNGACVINGARLKIGSIYRDEVVVEGRIGAVTLGSAGA